MTQQLRLGIPDGSLKEATAELFRSAGFKITFASRSYYPSIDDAEIHCTLIRAQEMPRYVEAGTLDCGLTGYDWVLENEAKVRELAELMFSKVSRRPVRWVLAVPNDSPIQKLQDLQGKRIATELVGVTRRYLAQHGVTANVEFSWGATEVKPPRFADAIVDVTETGSSLKANNLRVVAELMTSTTRFIANEKAYADPWKQRKMDDILLMLRGALTAEGMAGLKMNVRVADKDKVLAFLKAHPRTALNSPTLSPLADPEWLAMEIVIDEEIVRHIMPQLYAVGARGIVEYPINKIIL